MFVVSYSVQHFTFNRAEFATRRAFLDPTDVDAIARVFADAKQMRDFSVGWNAIRVLTPMQLAIRLASTATYVLRIQDVIVIRAKSYLYPKRALGHIKVRGLTSGRASVC